MINYYEELSPEEQRRVTESVQALYRQTFLLERRYEIGRASCRERV